MKKVARLMLGMALLVSTVVIGNASVFAQTFTSLNDIVFTTGFQVQNLSGSTANIEVQFYNATGPEGSAFTDDIAGDGSKTYFPLDGQGDRPSVPEGFEGSAIITSDQPVAAILNILGGEDTTNNQRYGGSISGISEGSSSVTLPLVQRQPGAGFDTWFAVQNVGDSSTTATITFVPADDADGNPRGQEHTETRTIPPGSAVTIDTEALASSIENDDGIFVGGVQVTAGSGGLLAAAANQTGGIGAGRSTLLSYGGFPAGSNTVSLPLVQNANAGFLSGIAIQNTSTTASASVTIDYGPNTANNPAFTPTDETIELGPGEGVTRNTGVVFGATSQYVGAATVTSTGAPVVVVVNQLKSTGVSVGSSYNGVDPADATDKVSAPLILSTPAFFTGFQCQNVGDAATTISVEFGPNTLEGETVVPPDATSDTLDPGESYRLLQSQTALGNPVEDRYRGSATFTSTSGEPIACIVNELVNPATLGDQFLTYNGASFE